jgi:hypothetical protein
MILRSAFSSSEATAKAQLPFVRRAIMDGRSVFLVHYNAPGGAWTLGWRRLNV